MTQTFQSWSALSEPAEKQHQCSKLAHEFKQLNKKVLVTTTTAIFCPENSDSDRTVVTKNPDQLTGLQNQALPVSAAHILQRNKLLGIDPEQINLLFRKEIYLTLY